MLLSCWRFLFVVMDEICAVVLDLGSDSSKAGFAGEQKPRTVFPSLLGKTKAEKNSYGYYSKFKFVGYDALSLNPTEVVSMERPICRGKVQDWDAVESILHYCFYNELRVAPEEHPIFFTEPPNPTERSREVLTQIMFETFSNPAMFVAPASLLALHACHKSSGIVVDFGRNKTDIIPIYNNTVLQSDTKTLQVGGMDISSHLLHLLSKKNYALSLDTANEIKEKLSYVSYNGKKEERISRFVHDLERVYNDIHIDTERFLCTEILFHPSLASIEAQGIDRLILEAANTQPSITNQLLSNIILTGGPSKHLRLDKRITEELHRSAPTLANPSIISAGNEHLSWHGGSMLANEETFQFKWISKEEYDEHGPRIIHRKCAGNK